MIANVFTEWHWDQGRVLYFQFDILREIAKVLVKFENRDINNDSTNTELRLSLTEYVGMPFAPESYKVNRNYSRVFQCAMLARSEGGVLVLSDICRQLATDGSALSICDNYLCEIVKRFRYPFPAFKEYDATSTRVYPFCAIIKYLVAKRELGVEPKASLSEFCDYIIGNNCTGMEDVDFYKSLKPTGYRMQGDGVRQLREMIAFISQFSFLKVFDGNLYLDINKKEDVQILVDELLTPLDISPVADKTEEFCRLTRLRQSLTAPAGGISHKLFHIPQDLGDLAFIEGKKVRVQHLRTERSALLRKYFVAIHPDPTCAACDMHVKEKYPWADYMLDLHHLLPLSSVVRISNMGTSLKDLVGLCPSCHRAIHTYYRKWLKANNQDDFINKQEAMAVYLEAVRGITR